MTPFTIWDHLARWLFWRPLYRPLMRLAHYFNWHHMPPYYPDHDIMLWCQWCGARYVVPQYPKFGLDDAVGGAIYEESAQIAQDDDRAGTLTMHADRFRRLGRAAIRALKL